MEWIRGFTDAQGNFIIVLRDNPRYVKNISFFENKSIKTILPKYVNLTFQIGLHIDSLNTLKFIQKGLKCGKISISKNQWNFYISDFYSIKNVVIPLFNTFQLNSTKYSEFIIFKNAAEIVQTKSHLTYKGLSKISNLKNVIHKNPYSSEDIKITNNWLLGFVEGDATFSTGNIYRPRLKFECHYKEEKLFHVIQKYLGKGKFINTERNRKNKIYKSVVLDITDIYYKKLILLPLFKKLNFHSNKYFDFCNWCYIVDLYFWGYHLTSEGRDLILEIKSVMNINRLIKSNKDLYLEDIKVKVFNLLSKSYHYMLKDGKVCKIANEI